MERRDELYQDVLLEHNRNPRHSGKPAAYNQVGEGYNPLCGDTIKLYVKYEQGKIADIGFEASGCVISKASASLMSEAVKGKTREEAEQLFSRFHQLVTEPTPSSGAPDLGELTSFSGVRQYPMRVKCATLAWHALRAALSDKS